MSNVILSYGRGVESTAILVAWDRGDLPRPFVSWSDLCVLTAAVGSEFQKTDDDVDEHILPIIRRRGARFVEVGRRGPSQAD